MKKSWSPTEWQYHIQYAQLRSNKSKPIHNARKFIYRNFPAVLYAFENSRESRFYGWINIKRMEEFIHRRSIVYPRDWLPF